MYLNLNKAPIALSLIFFVMLALIAITGNRSQKMEGGITGAPSHIMVPMGIAIGSGIAIIVIFIFIAFSAAKVLRSRA